MKNVDLIRKFSASLIFSLLTLTNVSLTHYRYTNKDFGEKVSSYDIFGVAALEVEVDVLTGNYLVSFNF